MRRLLFLMVALSPVILMSQGCDGQSPTSPDPHVRTAPVSEVSPQFSTVAVADASGLIEACYDGGGDLYVVKVDPFGETR